MKYGLLLVLAILCQMSFAKSLIHISGKSDMKVYYEYTDEDGNSVYPVYTSTAGTTSRDTGPSRPPVGVSRYGFLETSADYAYYGGDSAIITFETSDPNYTSSSVYTEFKRSLEFYYHMYGSRIGSIELQQYQCGFSCEWESIWSISGQEQSSSNDGWTKVSIPITYRLGLHKFRIKLEAIGGWQGDIGIANIKAKPREAASTKIECRASVGRLTEKIYNSDGSLDFVSRLAESVNIAKGTYQSVDVNNSNGSSSERDYYACSNSGFMGYDTDEGDGRIEYFPLCWKRGVGYINCP